MGFLSILKKIAGVTTKVTQIALPIAAGFIPGASPALKYINILTNGIVKAEQALNGEKQGLAKFAIVDTVLESIEQIDLISATSEELAQLATLRGIAINDNVTALNSSTKYADFIHDLHVKYHPKA